MPILNRLVDLYESRGFEIAAGFNPYHFDNFGAAPYTWIFRDGRPYTNALGIAVKEIYFLECLFENYHPRTIFIIGNSFGWSTFALALVNPGAHVVAIDAGIEEYSEEGVALTNRIASEENLHVTAVKAASPHDVGSVIAEHLGGSVDFAFIDGCHTNEYVVLDFNAVRPHGAPDCVYLFHDVHQCMLHEGFETVRRESGFAGGLLLGTTSGMGILYGESSASVLEQTVHTFSHGETALNEVRHDAWNARHHYFAKYHKSLAKRRNTVRGWLGKSPLPLP